MKSLLAGQFVVTDGPVNKVIQIDVDKSVLCGSIYTHHHY